MRSGATPKGKLEVCTEARTGTEAALRKRPGAARAIEQLITVAGFDPVRADGLADAEHLISCRPGRAG